MSKNHYKYIFAILLFALLFWLVDLEQLVLALSQLTVELAVYLIFLSVVLTFISAFKWKLFIDFFERSASLFRLFRLYLVGYFFNLLIPSYVGGDVVRSWYVGKKIGMHQAAAATILERFTGFVAMIILALVFMWFVEVVTWQIQLTIGVLALGLIAVSLIAVSKRSLDLFNRFGLLRSVESHAQRLQLAFQLASRSPSLIIKTMVLSFLFHTVTVVNVLAAALAVGWYGVPISDLFVVLPIILLIGSIPISPSGLGIQEGAFMFFLTALGASPAEALGIGILLRAKTYILALVGGVFWLGERSQGEGVSTGS